MLEVSILVLPGFLLFAALRVNNRSLSHVTGWHLILGCLTSSIILISFSAMYSSTLNDYSFSLNIPELFLKQKFVTKLPIELDIFLNSFIIPILIFSYKLVSTKVKIKKMFGKLFKLALTKEQIRKLKGSKGQSNRIKSFINILSYKQQAYFALVFLIDLIVHGIQFILRKLEWCALLILSPINDFLGMVLSKDDSVHTETLIKLTGLPVIITLKNNKVYIAILEEADTYIKSNNDDALKIMPLLSGYRDSKDQKLNITTIYVEKYISSFIVFKREVISITEFSKKQFDHFKKEGVLLASDESKKQIELALDDRKTNLINS